MRTTAVVDPSERNSTGAYTRSPGIEMRRMDDAAFLVDPATDAIYHLNATGLAVWNLLARPTSPGEAVALLSEAFPDADRADIEADVTGLIARLRRKGLITRCA